MPAPRMTSPLDLPPAYTAIVLREHRDAFVHAQSIATDAGAGTLVWVRRFDSVEIAVVLEPAEPLAAARRAIYAVMNAAGDALAVHCPPEKPLDFAWPDTILLDGGILGGVRLASPPGTTEDAVPDWLVAGVVLRMTVAHERGRPTTAHPLDITITRGTSLEIEGFEMMDAAALVSSFARHLLAAFDLWQEAGFDPIGVRFLARLPAEADMMIHLDTNGDLIRRGLVRGAGGSAQTPRPRLSLRDACAVPQWLDAATGDPWL